MATSTSISLTSGSTTFKLDANKVVFAYDDSNSKAVLTFENSYGVNETKTLTISTTSLVALSTNILFSTTILESSGQTKTVCFNNTRVLKLSANIDNASHTDIEYFTNTNEVPQKFVSTSDASTVSTACKTTIALIQSGTGTTFYANGFRVGTVTPATESGLVLESATVASRGTVMVAGTTTLTLTGGSSTVAATALVTNTEIATATKTANGTGYTAGDVLTLVSGTGTAGTITVNTVTGGAITTFTLTTRGNYTANPTLTNCTVTGGTGASATFTLVMGAKTVSVSNAGAYTALPSNPVSTTGGGNNATLTATWGAGAISGSKISFNDTNKAVYATLDVEETPAQVATLINAL